MVVTPRHVPESATHGRGPDRRGRRRPGARSPSAGLTLALVQAESGPPAVVGRAAASGVLAGIAFVVVERRKQNAMLPPSIFSSRQFTAANLLTFVVYAALGGVFFLLVVCLQVVLGYSPLAAGAASLPVTVIMLALSARAGALAQRIGPRLPLTVGPLLIAAGMLLMLRIDGSSSYVGSILPAVIVFGLGLASTVAPVTATVLAAVDDEHAGLASGVNNAVARTAQLVAVAVLPLAIGLSDDKLADPPAFTDAFHLAMVLAAGLTVIGSADRVDGDPQRRAGAGPRRRLGAARGPAPLHVRRGWSAGSADVAQRVPLTVDTFPRRSRVAGPSRTFRLASTGGSCAGARGGRRLGRGVVSWDVCGRSPWPMTATNGSSRSANCSTGNSIATSFAASGRSPTASACRSSR